MPNWVFNQIQAEPNVIKKMTKKYCHNEEFDFNMLIPMPESILNTTAGSDNDYDMYYYLSEKMTIPLEKVRKLMYSQLIQNQFSRDWLQTVHDRIQNGETNTPSYEKGQQLIENFKKYKSINWYDWSCDNWDTKWNACETSIGESDISFNTAWSAPYSIFEKMCQDFPKDKFQITCEDEEGNIDIYENDNGLFTLVETLHRDFEDEDWEEEECW